MKTPFSRPGRSGATAIEYGLIASLIGVAIVIGAATLGGKIQTALDGAPSHQPVVSEAMANTGSGG
jgi:Flp pilus assembly pilin Flp